MDGTFGSIYELLSAIYSSAHENKSINGMNKGFIAFLFCLKKKIHNISVTFR